MDILGSQQIDWLSARSHAKAILSNGNKGMGVDWFLRPVLQPPHLFSIASEISR